MTERTRPRVLSLRLLVCLLAISCGFVSGQDPTRGDRVPPGMVQGRGSDDPNTLRVNVRLVNIFTTVTDAHGAPISDLSKEDFRVLEDGVPQSISIFDRESEIPLSIVLAIDTSESTRKDLKLEVASAKKFVHSVVRPVDHLSVFQITENTDQLTGFSSDLKYLDRGIEALTAGAGTSLYDAIYLGAETLLDRKGRKVIVLITDGGDTTSATSYQNALRRAQEAEAIIYSIIVVPVAADAGRNLGGIAQLDSAFREISDELRTQYLIAYYPNRRVSDSPFRRIQVELKKKDGDHTEYKIRHRAGYYTAPAR